MPFVEKLVLEMQRSAGILKIVNMKIERVIFKNFGSYGNRTMELDIPAEPSFFLIQGENGNGKCLLPSTKIKTFSLKEDFEKFQDFLKLYRSKE